MISADTLFVNGNIATVDNEFSFVHAVAVKNGWVIDTGETADLRALYEGPNTQVIDLEGRTMLPAYTMRTFTSATTATTCATPRIAASIPCGALTT